MAMLSEGLRSAGHRVDFVTTVDPGPQAEEFEAFCDERWHFGDTGQLPANVYLSRFKAAILARRYDLLVIHHSHQAVAVAGLLPTSIATVSVIHEHPQLGAGHVALSNPGAFDAYVGVSGGVATAAKEMLGSSKRVETILNGIRCGSVAERPAREEFNALFVGHLVDAKGIHLVPRILREARKRGVPLRVTMIGDGPDRERLLGTIRAERVEPWIELIGNVPQPEVFARMESADVLLHCARHEGLGLVLPEAMSRGCIPIAANLPESTAEVVTSGVDGFLAADLDEYVEAIATLFHDRDRLATMRSAAHKTATSRFSAERMIDEYASLFRAVTELPPGRRRVQHCPSYA